MTDFDPITESDPTRPGCAAAQAALQRLLDREPDWDTPEAASHRAGCAGCRDELTLARSINGVITPVVVPNELSGRVLNASVAAHRRRQRIRWASAAFAVAASVVIAVIALRPGPAPSPTPNPIPEREPTPLVVIPLQKSNEAPALAKEKPLGESVSEAADAIVSLTRRTASEPKERITVLLPEPRLPGPGQPDERLDPLADAGTGAARSVEPIKDCARRAINFFIRTADPPARQ
jgi:hypothetical protein